MLHPQSRRTFLKTSALAGLGLSFFSGFDFVLPASQVGRSLSGTLASISIADDGARLARHATAIPSVIKDSIRVDLDEDDLETNSVLLGGHMPGGEDDLLALLSELRSSWPSPDDDAARSRETLALVAGHLFHQSLEHQLQPIYRRYNEAEAEEAQIYQDTAILRARSANTGRQANEEEVASLFDQIVPRTLIRYHTLVPDYDDPEGWIMRLVEWREQRADLNRRYAEAYANPDPAKVRRYVTDPNFYDADDPIIQLVRGLQNESADESTDVADVAAAPGDSLYAKALGESYARLEAVGAYFDRSVDEQTLRRRLTTS